MEQIGLDGIQEYEKYKEELRARLDETSENFIVIGYILKQVRDRRLYLNDGYSDINGFGMGTYGLSKATVSRFMNINTKFSVGGSSREIKPEYKGYGRSKIQEMLNVDAGDMELITADTTVEQVKELKKAENEQRQLEKEEQENSLPLVQMAAGPGEKTADPEAEHMEPFEAVMSAFWRENTELYRKVAAGLLTPEIIAEEISPSGSRTYRDGVNIMFFYDFDRGAKLRSYGHGKADITAYTYQEIMEKTRQMEITEKGVKRKTAEETEEETKEETKVSEKQLIEPVATPQSEPEEGPDPYTPVPGQTTVSDLQGVVPEDKETHPENAGDVIEGEYRELAAEQEDTEECPYTSIEIRHAIDYFDTEYQRMTAFGQNTAKSRNYRMAAESILKCYGPMAGLPAACQEGRGE